MVDEWKEFTAETREAGVEAARRHFSVSEAQLDVRVVSEQLEVSGLGGRVLVLASVKDEAPADLSDVGEFVFGVLQRMNLASRLRIRESDEEGDLVFRLEGSALESAVRRDDGIVPALAQVVERAAQRLLGEDLTVRLEVPRAERGGREERNGRRGAGRGERGDRGDRGDRGERRSRGEGRGRRGDDRGRRPRRSEEGDERLERMAREIAEEVKASGGERVLDAMSSRERWIVHNTIKDIEGVTSESVGDHDEKRVKILAQ